jgi:hypothetical protein
MSFWSFIRRYFSKVDRREERRLDNVEIINVVDGTRIKGHEAVKKYFEEEEKLFDEYGATLTFEVYMTDLQGDTLRKLQGERLGDLVVDGGFASGGDTVATVKGKIRALITERGITRNSENMTAAFTLGDAESVSFLFDGNFMKDDTLFYADNFILLPAWIQVLIHRCDQAEFLRLVAKLVKP